MTGTSTVSDIVDLVDIVSLLSAVLVVWHPPFSQEPDVSTELDEVPSSNDLDSGLVVVTVGDALDVVSEMVEDGVRIVVLQCPSVQI